MSKDLEALHLSRANLGASISRVDCQKTANTLRRYRSIVERLANGE